MVRAPLPLIAAVTDKEVLASALRYDVVPELSVMFPARVPPPLTLSISTTPPLRIRLFTVAEVFSKRSAPSSIWSESPPKVGLPLVGVRNREAVAVLPRTSYV
jgi:hypothetical protein